MEKVLMKKALDEGISKELIEDTKAKMRATGYHIAINTVSDNNVIFAISNKDIFNKIIDRVNENDSVEIILDRDDCSLCLRFNQELNILILKLDNESEEVTK